MHNKTQFTIEHLLSTVNYPGESLIEEIKIQADAIVVNQTDHADQTGFTQVNWHNHKVRILSLPEKGISLSRETALIRAIGNLLIFSDDDVIYYDNYCETITDAFNTIPQADIILFQIDRTENPNRPKAKQNNGITRVPYHKILRYGAINIVIKRQVVAKYNLHFDTIITVGEDSLFLSNAYKAGCKIYSCNTPIAITDTSNSSWFTGYNDNYLETRGVLFYRMSKKLFFPLCIQFAVRKRYLFKDKPTISHMLKIMKKGKQNFLKTLENISPQSRK